MTFANWRTLAFGCLCVLLAGSFIADLGTAPAAATAAEDDYEFGNLFDAPGVETTYYACTACHSEMIVAQQGMSRARWAKMLEWMVEEQGMTEIEEPELTEILDYLSTNYNVDRPNFPRPRGK